VKQKTWCFNKLMKPF